jgi:hypothetical protein
MCDKLYLIFYRLLEGMPEDEKPPVLLAIYADGIDRDEALHSSGRHKIHCTYLRFLNMEPLASCRSRYDYEIIQLINEDTLKQYGYDRCNMELVSMLENLVSNGITLDDGRKHAVRLAYLQVSFFQ